MSVRKCLLHKTTVTLALCFERDVETKMGSESEIRLMMTLINFFISLNWPNWPKRRTLVKKGCLALLWVAVSGSSHDSHGCLGKTVKTLLHVESDVPPWVCSYVATSSYQQSNNKYHEITLQFFYFFIQILIRQLVGTWLSGNNVVIHTCLLRRATTGC